MDLSEIKDDLDELYCNRESHWVPDIPFFDNPASGIVWKLGPIFTERETYGDDDAVRAFVTQVCATCVATQIEGPNPGLQGIAKIRMQIPEDRRNPSATKPVIGSTRLLREYNNHRDLTRLGCSCIPKLPGFVLCRQEKGEPLPGGFLSFLVMERLPGRNLVNFADLPMSERNEVRLAFAKTIREFYGLRYTHDDADRRNLTWDRENKKCYIIDLEDARRVDDDDDDPPKFRPALTYRHWGIAGPEINCSMYGLDPMVPPLSRDDEPLLEDPGDEALEKMAADSEGKELIFRR